MKMSEREKRRRCERCPCGSVAWRFTGKGADMCCSECGRSGYESATVIKDKNPIDWKKTKVYRWLCSRVWGVDP